MDTTIGSGGDWALYSLGTGVTWTLPLGRDATGAFYSWGPSTVGGLLQLGDWGNLDTNIGSGGESWGTLQLGVGVGNLDILPLSYEGTRALYSWRGRQGSNWTLPLGRDATGAFYSWGWGWVIWIHYHWVMR